jgi:PAS domain S-box-containing protein
MKAQGDGEFADAILDSLPGVFYLYDEDLHFLRWNREFTRVTGYSDEEMTRLSPLDLFAGADKELLRRRIAEVFSAGASSVEADFVARDGTHIPYYFTGVRTELGGRTCLMGVGIDISQRKHAEALLRESEERLRNVFDQANDGIFVISADERYLDANAKGLELLGYTRQEMLSMGVGEVLTPDERARLEVEPPGMMTGEPYLEQWEHLRKDGSTFVAEVSAQRLDAESYTAIVRDLTDRIVAERLAAESEERLRLALDAAHMGTFDWDLLADHIEWSRWHEEMWGFAPGDFGGTYEAFASRLHPEDLPGVTAEVDRCLAERDRFMAEFRVVWPDGSTHWVIGRGEFTFAGDGTPLRMRGVVVETTERRLAERALREREEDFRELFEQAPIGIFVSDADGNNIVANTAGCRLVGYSPDELAGLSVADLLMADELDRLAALITGLSGDRAAVGLWRFRRKDGNGFPGEVAVKRLADGRLQAFLTDVTERLAAEEEIRELNAGLERRVAERTEELAAARDRAEAADRLKSAFLATMSHELRTPLNSVIGFTGILLQDLAGPLNDEQRRQLRMVQGSARHLLVLINDVLDLSKIEAGELRVQRESFAVAPVVERAVDSVAPQADKKGVVLRLEMSGDPGMLVSDERRVEQVLLNLLSNAVKFTDEGEVQLVVELADSPRAQVRFRVRDSGIGIRPEDLDQLFQPFSQVETGLARKHEGTGLGLAICRRLVDLLGGEIEVASTYGAGSEFTFSLPRGGEGA